MSIDTLEIRGLTEDALGTGAIIYEEWNTIEFEHERRRGKRHEKSLCTRNSGRYVPLEAMDMGAERRREGTHYVMVAPTSPTSRGDLVTSDLDILGEIRTIA